MKVSGRLRTWEQECEGEEEEESLGSETCRCNEYWQFMKMMINRKITPRSEVLSAMMADVIRAISVNVALNIEEANQLTSPSLQPSIPSEP